MTPADAMIDAMIKAGRLARQASTTDGARTVEVLITEDGWVIRGRLLTAGDTTQATALDLHWPEFEGNPDLLANSVGLVADRLGAPR